MTSPEFLSLAVIACYLAGTLSVLSGFISANAGLKRFASYLALAAFVMERNSLGGSVDLAKVMTCGLAHYAEAQAAGAAPVEPEKDLDAEEFAQF